MFFVGAVALFIKLMHDIMLIDLLTQVLCAAATAQWWLYDTSHNMTQFSIFALHDWNAK